MQADRYETDSSKVLIERAVSSNAEAILRLKQAAWLNAYVNHEHGTTREDILKKLSDDAIQVAIPNWQLGIAGETHYNTQATFVARMGGKVVGFTAPRLEDGQKRIGAMYVSPEMQGRGIGGELLRAALKWHGNEDDVFLHVVAYNEAAIGFYEHHGFEKTGVETPEMYDEEPGIKLLPEIEMVLRAGRPSV